MKRIMIFAICCVFCLVFVTGCAVRGGRHIATAQVTEIQEGVTTLQEIQQSFGKPSSTSISGDGERWFYRSVSYKYIPLRGARYGSQNQQLVVDFNRENKVNFFVFSNGSGY